MANKYIKLDLTTGRLTQQEATTVGGNSSYAGQLVALGADGMIPTVMLGSVGSPSIFAIADVALAAGELVNVFFAGGVKKVRKATSVDAVALAHGFVLDPISATTSGAVQMSGINSKLPKGALTTADIGKRVFLSTTAGAAALTPPQGVGNVIQTVGVIIDVGDTLAQIVFEPEDGIVV